MELDHKGTACAEQPHLVLGNIHAMRGLFNFSTSDSVLFSQLTMSLRSY